MNKKEFFRWKMLWDMALFFDLDVEPFDHEVIALKSVIALMRTNKVEEYKPLQGIDVKKFSSLGEIADYLWEQEQKKEPVT